MAASGNALLGLEDVTLCYATSEQIVTATWRVSFDVAQGDRFILLGPSGCGKSSLLKAVGGYMTPTEGHITLKGQPVTRPGPDRMMVFQEFDQLLPWKTVKQNIMFPMLASGKYSRAEAADRADRYIEKVNCNKNAPQNHNIVVDSLRSDTVDVFQDGHWGKKPKKNTMKSFLDNKEKELMDLHDGEKGASLHHDRRKLIRYTVEDDDDDEVRQRSRQVERLLYEHRDIMKDAKRRKPQL